jgi:hypothetical protein
MARRIEVDIVGDASSLQRAFRETATGAQRFEAKITGSFHNIARSAVLAGGAFVGFSAAGEALKTVIGAAVDAQVSSRQLSAQMKASGESFRANQAAIEHASLALAKYGYTIEDSEKALTVLDRGTRNIGESLRLEAGVADIAKAKHIGLADAAAVVAKVFGGQETALRRAIPGLSKHAHGLDLISQAYARVRGQAGAGTTAEDRFRAELHDTEVIIGRALLPTVNKLLAQLTVWLEKMNRSGRLQRDVNEAVKVGSAVVHDLAGAFRTLSSVLGGNKQAVEALVAAFAAFKTASFLEAVANITASVAGIGRSARTSTVEVTGLRAALGRLAAVGVVGVTVAVGYEVAKGGEWLSKALGKLPIPGVGDKNLPAGSLPDSARLAVAQGRSLSWFVGAAGIGGASSQAAAAAYRAAVASTVFTVARPSAAQRAANIAAAAGGPAAARARATAAAAIRAGGYPVLSDQALALGYPSLASALAGGPGAAGGAVSRFRIPSRIAGTAVIPGLAAFGRTETAGFAAGLHSYLGAFGPITGWQVPMNLQIAQARAGAFGTPAAQTSVLRRIRAAAEKALHSGRLVGQAWIDVYDTIASINQQLQQQAIGGATKFRHISRAVFTVGAHTDAYAYGGARTVVIHNLNLHGIQDINALESQLEARAKRRPQPRRGR